jgi:hypothetical protein
MFQICTFPVGHCFSIKSVLEGKKTPINNYNMYKCLSLSEVVTCTLN